MKNLYFITGKTFIAGLFCTTLILPLKSKAQKPDFDHTGKGDNVRIDFSPLHRSSFTVVSRFVA